MRHHCGPVRSIFIPETRSIVFILTQDCVNIFDLRMNEMVGKIIGKFYMICYAESDDRLYLISIDNILHVADSAYRHRREE